MASLVDGPDIRQRVRRALGFPKELPTESVVDALLNTVRRIAFQAGTFSERQMNLTSVANQQAYVLDATIADVVDVFWPGALFRYVDPEFPLPAWIAGEVAYSNLADRSLDLIREIERTQHSDTGDAAASWFVRIESNGDRKLYLMPIPSQNSVTIPTLCLVDMTVGSFNDRHRELLVTGAAADCALEMAGHELQSVVVDGSSGGGTRLGSDVWLKLEERLRAKHDGLVEQFKRGLL